MHIRALITAAILLPLTACGAVGGSDANTFVAALMDHCGKAYRGQITSTDREDDAWRAEDIIVHVTCTREAIRMPLHVGENRSRTWVLTHENAVMELRHDHRHEDGSEDALTQYGGFSSDASTATRMEFPADDSTKALFDREEIPVSKQNTWAMDVRPQDNLIAYEMSRPERFFRIEFDTSAPVDVPPPPWGADLIVNDGL